MKRLTKDEILAVDDVQSEDVEVPEWGGVLTVRGLTGYERDKFETSLQHPKTGKVDTSNVRAKLLVLCVVDESGQKVFKPTDFAALGNRSAKVLERLVNVAKRLSGMDEEALKEIEGNSEGSQSDDSGCTSPEISESLSGNSRND